MEQRKIAKFLIGYFSAVGLIFLMVPINALLSSLLSGGNTDTLSSVSNILSLVAKLLVLLYLYFLWRRWKNTKLVIGIGLSVFISTGIFAILFAFTFPLWIVVGIICFSYGYATGIFKESTVLDAPNTAEVIKPAISRKNSIIALLLLVLALYFGIHFVWFGSLTRNCIYTEKEFPVPQELAKGTITIAQDAYEAIGVDKDYECLSSMGKIGRELVSPKTIDNIGMRYFETRGQEIKTLPKGKTFHVTRVFFVTPHGLSTIDSGSGPISYLVLKDGAGKEYSFAIVHLGSSEDALFLSFSMSTSTGNITTTKLLSLDSFEGWKNDSEPFVFTGRLTELSFTNLDNGVPEWRRLLNRMEKGEKLLLHIELLPWDEHMQTITYSDDNAIRPKQIAQLENAFLEKLPKNFATSVLDKNANWPYFTMQGSPNLLNYLVSHQVELHIKTFSELITTVQPQDESIQKQTQTTATQQKETYTACGCGCCSGELQNEKCLYRSKGDDLEKIKEDDLNFSKSSQCSVVGCSIATLYQYCD